MVARPRGPPYVLSSAFRFFVECRWCETNPCHDIRRLEVPDGVYTWIRTREEMTKLLVACPRGVRELALSDVVHEGRLLRYRQAPVATSRPR